MVAKERNKNLSEFAGLLIRATERRIIAPEQTKQFLEPDIHKGLSILASRSFRLCGTHFMKCEYTNDEASYGSQGSPTPGASLGLWFGSLTNDEASYGKEVYKL